MVDEDLNYLVVNDRYRELHELPEELVGKGKSMLEVLRMRAERGDYGPGDTEKLLQERIDGYRSGQVARTEDTAPSGRIIEVFRAPSVDGGVVGVVNDITERKRAEADIAEKTRVLEATMNNMDEGILMVDHDRAIVMHNGRVVELLELPEAFFDGSPQIESLTRLRSERGDYGSIDPDEHARRIIDAVTEVEKTSETQFLETTTPAGKNLEMRLNSLAGGGIVATYADITRRKEIEDELRLAKAVADAANMAKSEFLSSMSHELRTPMNAILGFSEHMIDDSDNPLNEEQQDSAQEILSAGQHLLKLIEDVLDLAKIESGRVALSIESVEVPKVVAECLQLSRSFRTPVSVTFNDEVSDRSLPPILVDRTRLKQVMINLLSNAMKFNVEGGSVTVSSSVEGDKLRLIVSDTGKGIPPESMEDLFSPFNRLGAEYGEIEGTGIGLTITKSLIEQMGGDFGVESTVGEGSTFWVEFEIADEADQVIDVSADELPEEIVELGDDSDAVARTVLYVEDNPANLRLMRKLLGRRGKFNLIDAPTAELGLALAYDHRPDVILMDINLPGIDGFQALKELQGSPETKDIPVIAVSASVLPYEVEHGLRAGFVDYLKKPISIKVLIEAIGKATGKAEE